MQHIAPILDQLDHSDEDARVALPQENPFDVGDWIARDEVLYLAIVVGQHNHRNVESSAPDLARKVGGIHVSNGEVGDDEIELRT